MTQADQASSEPIRTGEFDDSVIDPISVRSLFAAVIERAFLDACWPKVSSNSGSFYSSRARDDARSWLTTPSKDLATSCMGAGLDYESVVAKARALRNLGWPMPQALRLKARAEKSAISKEMKLAA